MTTSTVRAGHEADEDKRGRVARVVEGIGDFWTLGVLGLLLVVFTVLNSVFLSQGSWLSISLYATSLLVVAIGETFVIISGGIDLSIGATLAFAAMSGAAVMRAAGHAGLADGGVMLLGAIVTLVVGLAVGVLNGFLITRLKLAPFIATLGVMGICGGGTLLLNNGNAIYEIPPQWSDLGRVTIGGWFPFPVIVAAAICVVMWLTLGRLRFGRHIYAIGSNEEAARRAGIRVDRSITGVYALSGVLAGVAGLLLVTRFGIAHPNFGSDALLPAIAAVVIGGGSLTGGRGTVGGTIIGTAVISVLLTGLILAGVEPFWQTVAVGIVIIVAVYVDQLRLTLRK